MTFYASTIFGTPRDAFAHSQLMGFWVASIVLKNFFKIVNVLRSGQINLSLPDPTVSQQAHNL